MDPYMLFPKTGRERDPVDRPMFFVVDDYSHFVGIWLGRCSAWDWLDPNPVHWLTERYGDPVLN